MDLTPVLTGLDGPQGVCYAENVAYVVESGENHIVLIDLGKKASRKGDSRNAQNLCIDSSTDLTALAISATERSLWRRDGLSLSAPSSRRSEVSTIIC